MNFNINLKNYKSIYINKGTAYNFIKGTEFILTDNEKTNFSYQLTQELFDFNLKLNFSLTNDNLYKYKDYLKNNLINNINNLEEKLLKEKMKQKLFENKENWLQLALNQAKKDPRLINRIEKLNQLKKLNQSI